MKTIILYLLVAVASVSARAPRIVSLTLEDHHGFHETVTAKDRLSPHHKTNWLHVQPYRKVVRTYDTGGTFITAYHDNGHPKQYLQVVEGRAYGRYVEWHSNGQIKVSGRVIGGRADVDEGSADSYLFDGMTEAWNEEGSLVAQIPYEDGSIHGSAVWYHPEGGIESRVDFVAGQRHGLAEDYYVSGALKQRAEYVHGQQHGETVRIAPDGSALAEETYQGGRLVSGHYVDGAAIVNGTGIQRLALADGGYQEKEHIEGLPDGAIRNYDASGALRSVVHVADGRKYGEETLYYPPPMFGPIPEVPSPKILFTWHQDELQGTVQSWYPNGQLESQRELVGNQKNGLHTAWYEDGALMLIEEYRDDQLIKGEYYAPGSVIPESRVAGGTGTATLFDARGHVTSRISYLDGAPVS